MVVSYSMVVMVLCVLMSLGLADVSWVILVMSVAMLVTLLSYSGYSYTLQSEWLGVDDMGILMVLLSLVVTVMSMVSSNKELRSDNVSLYKGFSAAEMIMYVCLGSVLFFSACNWMDFFFFFEASLIPTFFLIVKWGYQPERLEASMYMMLYTVGFSLPLLMGLMFFWSSMSSDMMLLAKMLGSFSYFEMNWTWLLMSLSFLVKLPIYGMHGWLPKAHVEAPLSGSMMLAGILLKFGGYGLIRFMWFSEVPLGGCMVLVFSLSLWGGLLSSCICCCQSDLKSLIAYSSVGHMCMGLCSLLTMYSVGKLSCVCMLFCHGLCSPILFSLAASSYDFCNSRSVMLSKGVLRIFPFISMAWFIACVVNMGFPPSLNFFSEVFCLGSMLWMNPVGGVISGLTCLVAGAYCLIMYSMVNHGVSSEMVNCPNLNMSERYIYCCVFAFYMLFGGSLCLDMFFV
uniref:NADH dehydrogenase subunit 4 n=1 Tax=Cryptonema producta TaxID=870231 RepID=UPI0022379A42|nr:NADH dehydrogenase subunit 4 [Cryptonema producta]UYR95081.1 NADH dehydrogenase subunit 4 [Cryptonema producta]